MNSAKPPRGYCDLGPHERGLAAADTGFRTLAGAVRHVAAKRCDAGGARSTQWPTCWATRDCPRQPAGQVGRRYAAGTRHRAQRADGPDAAARRGGRPASSPALTDRLTKSRRHAARRADWPTSCRRGRLIERVLSEDGWPTGCRAEGGLDRQDNAMTDRSSSPTSPTRCRRADTRMRRSTAIDAARRCDRTYYGGQPLSSIAERIPLPGKPFRAPLVVAVGAFATRRRQRGAAGDSQRFHRPPAQW